MFLFHELTARFKWSLSISATNLFRKNLKQLFFMVVVDNKCEQYVLATWCVFESKISPYIGEMVFKYLSLAFDLNLCQAAINLGWIGWKQLFWQLLPNFCHLTSVHINSQVRATILFMECVRAGEVENSFAMFGCFDWKAVPTSVETFQTAATDHHSKIYMKGILQFFAVFQICFKLLFWVSKMLKFYVFFLAMSFLSLFAYHDFSPYVLQVPLWMCLFEIDWRNSWFVTLWSQDDLGWLMHCVQ